MTPETKIIGFEHILTAAANFYKATNVTDSAKTNANEASVADAFRSPPPEVAAKKADGLRLRVHEDQLQIRKIRPVGWAAFWGFFFPNATVLELSGMLNVTLSVFPTHVQIEKRRWRASSVVLPNYSVSIPLYDEVGDFPIHQLHINSSLAFLYPFVPMHVEVMLDDKLAFGQGKFDPE